MFDPGHSLLLARARPLWPRSGAQAQWGTAPRLATAPAPLCSSLRHGRSSLFRMGRRCRRSGLVVLLPARIRAVSCSPPFQDLATGGLCCASPRNSDALDTLQPRFDMSRHGLTWLTGACCAYLGLSAREYCSLSSPTPQMCACLPRGSGRVDIKVLFGAGPTDVNQNRHSVAMLRPAPPRHPAAQPGQPRFATLHHLASNLQPCSVSPQISDMLPPHPTQNNIQ